MAGIKVKKSFGKFPERIIVNATYVEFNEEGIAEIEDEEVLSTLGRIQGYEVLEAKKASEEPPEDPKEPEGEEDPSEEEKAPAKKTPARKPSPRKPSTK